jgi:hypothetical protein
MSRLVDLYPTAWRNRYEEEFLALLAERPPATIGDRFDLIRGAIDARLHPQVPSEPRAIDWRGIAPLAGLALFAAAISLAANGPVQFDDYGQYRDGSAAIGPFILSLVLLSIGMYRLVLRLPVEDRVSRGAGWIAIVTGPMWATMPWVVPMFLVFLAGSIGLAVGARRARILPTWAVGALVVALSIPGGILIAQLFLPWYAFRVSGLDMVLLIGPISLLWVVFSGLLVRTSARQVPAPEP